MTLTTIVAAKPLAGALGACAWCLEKDPLHFHPGRTRIARVPDALVLATATRTEKVKLRFRISCEPGETWMAVVDAAGTSRLAKALRPVIAGRKNGGATVEIERTERALVLAGGGQRMSVPACEPMPEDAEAPRAGEATSVAGARDLASRIADAMTFCKPAEYRAIAKGPFVYLAAGDGGLVVPVVVATDGHRLFVDGDARDCADAKFVFQVPGDDWKPAARAMVESFDFVRLVRTVVPQPAEEDGKKAQEKSLWCLVFESADRRVEIAVGEPETSLPHWAGFVPRETANPDLSVACDRDELAAAVKATAGVSSENGAACMFRADPATGLLRIATYTDADGGTAQREIAADIRHAPAGFVHLSGKYVLDALGAVRTDRVRIWQHAAPLDAVRLIEVAGDGATLRPRAMVVMPIRGHDPVESTSADESAQDAAPQAAAL
ncbi:MAG: hypothetical protein HY907_11310 [Deltaproteobacteria bacterium]|nr:hypothetical protein [Deltaproteobacteria bacterium]